MFIPTKENIIASFELPVECETCGCLLHKKTAINGKSVIDTKRIPHISLYGIWNCEHHSVEEIRTVYYCKVHAPKK